MLELEKDQKLQRFPGGFGADAQRSHQQRKPIILTSQVPSHLQERDCSPSRIVVEPIPIRLFDLRLLVGRLGQLPPTTVLLVHYPSIPNVRRYTIQLYLLYSYRTTTDCGVLHSAGTASHISCVVLLFSHVQRMASVVSDITLKKRGCEGANKLMLL